MKKIVSLAAVMVTAAALITAGIAPAQAAGVPTLPANQHLFVVDCADFMPQLWSVDSTNGDATAVGSQPASGDYCGGGAQYNPVDGKSYAIIYAPEGTSLFTFDTETGDYTSVGLISGATTDGWVLAITKAGDAFMNDGSNLYSLDLTTAETTLVGSIGFSPQALAYNPVDDTVYAFNRGNANVYSVNLSTGLATLEAAKSLTMPASVTCMDGSPWTTIRLNVNVFDANGNLWMQTDYCQYGSLMVADFATGVVTYLGQFNDVDRSKYTNSPNYNFYVTPIFITTDVVDPAAPAPAPAPALPDTGASAMVLVSTGVIAAGLLAAGALALVMLRRRLAAK
jgi:hypothetical protein